MLTILPSDEYVRNEKLWRVKPSEYLQEECNMVIGIIVVLVIVGIVLLCKEASRYTEEERYITAIVMHCEKGNFHENSYYQNLATINLTQKNYAMYAFYSARAKEEGEYDYHITAEENGKRYVVVRDKPMRIGMSIRIREVEVYRDGEWVETKYE